MGWTVWLAGIVKENAYYFIWKPGLISHAKWEPLEMSELKEVVNMRRYRKRGGQKETTTLITN